MNALIMQRYGCYANIQMDVSAIVNVMITQRCKRCTSDSPGLTSESEGYPGSFAVNGNNAVGVVPFIPRHFIAAFHAENVQHLRRWPPHYMHNPGLAGANPGLSKVQRLQRWSPLVALFPAQHTLTQGSLHYRLATLGNQKRNTDGVETYISQYELRYLAPGFMADYA